MKLSFLAIALMLIVVVSCKTLKPYEKEFLLSPLMDDTELGFFQSQMPQAAQLRWEKLSAGSGVSAGTSSCPSCGG